VAVIVASPPVESTIADHFDATILSNASWREHFRFDIHSREEGDFALKGPCDEARFLGFLKKASGQVTIIFLQDSNERPQSKFANASRLFPWQARPPRRDAKIQKESENFAPCPQRC
jgi:hypothetical protein